MTAVRRADDASKNSRMRMRDKLMLVNMIVWAVLLAALAVAALH